MGIELEIIALILVIIVRVCAFVFTLLTIDKIHKNDKKKVLFGVIAAVLYALSFTAQFFY